jgi:ribosomal protein S18 acetylase RimI-like enzyme
MSVRPARATDAQGAARAQLAAWRTDRELPGAVLDELDLDGLTAQWTEAAVRPPSPRHRVLVAVEGDGEVVGVAATAPAADPDRDPRVDGDLLALAVHPEHRHRGHGSRLLQAAADTMIAAGFTSAYAWVEAHDDVGRAFLVDSGWAPDGAHRTLDLDGTGAVTLTEVRLHTSLVDRGADEADHGAEPVQPHRHDH